jgi:two-component sensor histidine kinase
MPSPNPWGRHLLAYFLLLAALRTEASISPDSLHYALGSEATVKERMDALLALAERDMANNPATALGHARRALSIAEDLGNASDEHRAWLAIGAFEERAGLRAEHVQSVLRALKLSQAMGSAAAMAEDLRELSRAYLLNGRTDKAVSEAQKALTLELPQKDPARIIASELLLMDALRADGRWDEALRIGRQILVRLEGQPPSRNEMLTHLLMARILLDRSQPHDALPLLIKAERGSTGVATPQDLFDLQATRARIHLDMGRTSEARTACEQAADQLKRAYSWSNASTLKDLQYHLALAQQDWKQALGHLQWIEHQQDSLQRAQVALKVAALQEEHRTQRAEQDNAQLRDQNAQQQHMLAQEKRRGLLVMTLATALLVLTVALLIMSRYLLRNTWRLKLKNEVVNRQRAEIEAKNLELERQNLRLKESLISEEEKEIVIKEIHHRVKNNLQVVDSLLSLRSDQMTDPQVKRLFDEARGRIRSMAQVHEHIYRNVGRDTGPLKAYLEKLSRTILATHGAHDRISVQVSAEPVQLPDDSLLPLSLVINELLTNAVKYAFRGDAVGQVNIILRSAGNGYELLFSDDGGGMGQEPILTERSFGLELVRVLAHQLNGELHILKGSGTTFSLTFRGEERLLRSAS